MDSVSRAIGSLEASVKGLQQAVESQGRVAQASRDSIHEKLEEGSHEFAALRHEVQGINLELVEIKPAVQRFERDRQAREAKRSLMITLYTGVVAFAAGLGYATNFVIEYLKSRSH